FLYMSLLALKDMELRVSIEAETFGLDPALPLIGPESVLGIEINPYAAELARVSVWIGHIQWARRNGFPLPADPVLRPLQTIECRDAVLAPDGSPAHWPAANAIIGNPPFLGGKRLRNVLGDAYCDQLFAAYGGQVPAEADLVCYWLARASGGRHRGGRARWVGGDQQHQGRREPARAGADRGSGRHRGGMVGRALGAGRRSGSRVTGVLGAGTGHGPDARRGARSAHPRGPDRGCIQPDHGTAIISEYRSGVSGIEEGWPLRGIGRSRPEVAFDAYESKWTTQRRGLAT
ncbi:MAG TPA: DNA methyltransferase, partial [Acetobacteraceae bacterium]|nr:DNA methyltransferase [Acetobacteraceae bacterium]